MADIMRRRPRSLGRGWDWPFRRFFEDLYGDSEEGTGLPELWSQGRFVPAIDVAEDDESLTLTAEVPGMKSEDLDVTVDNGVLTLRGEKREEQTKEGGGYHRVERRYGQFERRIRLPNYVDPEKIDASYKDGVLRLVMPKMEAAKTKSIQIKAD
jgi:HSP20 family protein